jgi:NO-binding membrane sensor protein with MHYT domain
MLEEPSRRRALLLYVICGGVIMGAGLGARHVQGLFMLPMASERGFTRETFGFAIACQNLIWGLALSFPRILGRGRDTCASSLFC